MSKKCTKCGQEKDLTEFHRNKNTRDEHSTKCKSCSIKDSLLVNKKNKDIINARRRERRKQDSEFRERINSKKRKSYWDNRRDALYSAIKSSSKRRGIFFDISKEDIVIPEYCPILNVKLDQDRYSPSLDRFDNSKGYVKGNIWVISKKANTMKNDGSIKELVEFCKNLPQYLNNMI